MKSVICTLFERHFHRGLVGLINSLHKNGYRGDIYAGYLGALPSWAKINENSIFEDRAIETFIVDENIKVHFIPLKTDYHLTNYKPDFMKWVLNGPAKDAENIFYFDTDIVINYSWNFFEEWVSYGVALCTDINSPLDLNHPRRMAWSRYFTNFDITLNFTKTAYANGGFVGLSRKDAGFISNWIMVQEHISPLIGGLQWSSITGKRFSSTEHLAEYFAFKIPDQDALNITIGTWAGVVTFVGKEGMGFEQGPALMFHALGASKPWRMNYLKRMLLGFRPRKADKSYWDSVSNPIELYSKRTVFWKKLMLNLASFIGRFYGKS